MQTVKTIEKQRYTYFAPALTIGKISDKNPDNSENIPHPFFHAKEKSQDFQDLTNLASLGMPVALNKK